MVTFFRPFFFSKTLRLNNHGLAFISAAIVMPDADMSLALPSILFSAIGTAGQRCTSTRRLYLHRSIAPQFLEQLQAAYATISIGDPLDSSILLGPLHSPSAVQLYMDSVKDIRETGGTILCGGMPYIHPSSALKDGNFVLPVIALPSMISGTVSGPTPEVAETIERIWKEETFAPVLKVALFDELEEAIALNNAVPQGLSSSLWSNDVRHLGKWIGPEGSDTGIVNVGFFFFFF
jgi:aldehyde dehydrogenase family 7 member A1